MNSWFIQIENKINKIRMTIYDNGLVYGNERNEKLFILSPTSIDHLKGILNENMYMLKKLGYYNEKLNPLVLKINNTSRNHKIIKVVGWSQTPKILNIIKDENNHLKNF